MYIPHSSGMLPRFFLHLTLMGEVVGLEKLSFWNVRSFISNQSLTEFEVAKSLHMILRDFAEYSKTNTNCQIITWSLID